MHPLKKRPELFRPLPAFLSLETGAHEVNEPRMYVERIGSRFDPPPVKAEPVVEATPLRDWSEFDAPAWQRRNRNNPMRRSTSALLYPLPSLLRRQAG